MPNPRPRQKDNYEQILLKDKLDARRIVQIDDFMNHRLVVDFLGFSLQIHFWRQMIIIQFQGFKQHRQTSIMEVNQIFCIGSNKFGQAGAGKKYHNQTFATFNKIVFPVFIKQVVCGSHHSGLLTLDGFVYMMGSNTNGALGTPSSTINYSYSPILVQNLSEVSKISSGHYHMCAISEGKLYSWGKGADGQLGTGKQVNCPTPMHVESFGEDVEQVSCGLNHTLVKTTNSKCYAFGNGIYGQLGVGNNKNSLFPVQVKIDEVSEIAAGENFSLFLKGTAVYGAGDNSSGQLSSEVKKKYALQPVQLNVGRATIIRAGRFSAAVIEDRQIRVWGLKSMTLPITLSAVPGYVMDLQTGGNLVYCLTSEGELYQWRFQEQVTNQLTLTDLKEKAILGFAVGQSHSFILGDIAGQVNPTESILKCLQNLQDPEVLQDQPLVSKTNTQKMGHNISVQSSVPSISSEHYSRTPSSIMREPSNFIKCEKRQNSRTPPEMKNAESKRNIQITEFMREKSASQLNHSSRGVKQELELSDCMKKIDDIMAMLAKNNRLCQIQSSCDISRKNTRSKLERTASRDCKENRGEKTEKCSREYILELREKQLKISELQEKLSRKDIEIESQRQLINLLRKINSHHQ